MASNELGGTQTQASRDYLDELNPEQRCAVEFGMEDATGGGPLLIIAGAGTGKTQTLAYRLAHLLVRGADARRVLLMTFSRRAARELEHRVGKIVQQVLNLDAGTGHLTLPWCGTFHGIGARLLREYATRVGLDASFTILDRADSVDLMGIVRYQQGYSETERRFPSKASCLSIYSRAVNSREPLQVLLDGAYPWCSTWKSALDELFAAYVAQKQAQHILDYDDLLLYWAHMMEDPELGGEIGARFDHVLVDEYQDTNALQSDIVHALRPSGHGVTVVGDDAQSIYSFRSATVRNILDFAQHYQPAAARVSLARNYRSSPQILSACNAVIGLAKEGFEKRLWSDRAATPPAEIVEVGDETDQAQYVARSILERRETGMALRNQAVLFRTSSHSALLEIELARRDIPFVKYGGLRFLEAAHIKDVLSLLRWADNPHHGLAATRVAQLLPGVGPATASRIAGAAASGDMLAALDRLEIAESLRAPWDELRRVLRRLSKGAARWPLAIGEAIEWYLPHLERIYDDARVRRIDLEDLARMAALHGTRERFLTEMTLDPPEAVGDEAGAPYKDDDFLVLSTIHSAKGREWRAVSVLNVVDGCIPSDMATGTIAEIEEERRLLYVAMTRARDHLSLVVPRRFYIHQQSDKGDRHVYAQRSRFVPDALLPHFALSAWLPTVPLASSSVPKPNVAPIDLAEKVRRSWERN